MSAILRRFRLVRRPVSINSSFSLIVVDGLDRDFSLLRSQRVNGRLEPLDGSSLRAVVDCLIPASCASEYVRGKRGERRLVSGFIAGLQRSVGRWKHMRIRIHRDSNRAMP